MLVQCVHFYFYLHLEIETGRISLICGLQSQTNKPNIAMTTHLTNYMYADNELC
jgi:hypothetical protein